MQRREEENSKGAFSGMSLYDRSVVGRGNVIQGFWEMGGGAMLKENEVAKTIVDVAYYIHRKLGPGLLESVYHAIMKYELQKRGLRVLSREPIPVVWDEVRLELGFEADLIVEDVVVVELKSVEEVAECIASNFSRTFG